MNEISATSAAHDLTLIPKAGEKLSFLQFRGYQIGPIHLGVAAIAIALVIAALVAYRLRKPSPMTSLNPNRNIKPIASDDVGQSSKRPIERKDEPVGKSENLKPDLLKDPKPNSPVNIPAKVEEARVQVIQPPQKPFKSFDIKILDKAYHISSEEELRRTVRALGGEVSSGKYGHGKLTLDFPNHWSSLKIDAALVKQFVTELRTVADVFETNHDYRFYVAPKVIETQEGTLTIRKYSNGVVEVVSSKDSCRNDWTGRRVFSNGRVESGDFRNFELHSGTYVEEGMTTYHFPKHLIQSYGKQARSLMCTQDNEGKTNLIVLAHKNPESDIARTWDYVQVNEDPTQVLVRILKEDDLNFHHHAKGLKEVLSGPLDCEKFIQHLIKTNEIFSINSRPLVVLLAMIKEKGLKVNLHHQHPDTQETLLDLHSNNEYVLKALLAADPTLIQRSERMEAAIVRSFLSNRKKPAQVLLKALEAQNIPLLPKELLYKKVAFADDMVTLEELKALTRPDQETVYQLANGKSRFDVVEKMRTLGFVRDQDVLINEGPSILGFNMDAVEINEGLNSFLTDLRSKGLLLTEDEFGKLDKKKYVSKGDDIGRILGRDYIEKKAHELGLKHVKVPRKMIVINPNKGDDLKLRLREDLSIFASSNGVEVYAEKIRESSRKVTTEEVAELLRLFEMAGFNDIHWGNVIVADDGVYIVDTEFTNFWVNRFYFKNGRQHAEMAKIVHALPKEQQQPFIDEINAKIEAYREVEEEYDRQRKLLAEAEQAALKKNGCFYGPTFTFSITALTANNQVLV